MLLLPATAACGRYRRGRLSALPARALGADATLMIGPQGTVEALHARGRAGFLRCPLYLLGRQLWIVRRRTEKGARASAELPLSRVHFTTQRAAAAQLTARCWPKLPALFACIAWQAANLHTYQA